MKMMTVQSRLLRGYLLLLICLPVLHPAAADTAENEADDGIECAVPVFRSTGNSELDELASENIEFSKESCLLYLDMDLNSEKTDAHLDQWLERVYTHNSEALERLFTDTGRSAEFRTYFDNALHKARENVGERNKLLRLADRANFDEIDSWSLIFVSTDDRFSLSIDDPVCAAIGGDGANCPGAFRDVANAVNYYRHAYDNLVIDDIAQNLDSMSLDWDRFTDEARQQTIVDAWATTLVQSGHFRKDHLVGPPSVQYFLLHPGVVYEYLGDAPEGEQDKVALSMEWLGVNFWDWKVPVGFSLISVYADRSVDSDTGWGGMIYFDNAYSFGWVNRDSGTGYFLSIDLLKAVTDKKEQLDTYKKLF